LGTQKLVGLQVLLAGTFGFFKVVVHPLQQDFNFAELVADLVVNLDVLGTNTLLLLLLEFFLDVMEASHAILLHHKELVLVLVHRPVRLLPADVLVDVEHSVHEVVYLCAQCSHSGINVLLSLTMNQ
jgi:hypothetical protein